MLASGLLRKVVHKVPSREWAGDAARRSEGFLWATFRCWIAVWGRTRGALETRAETGDVLGNSSSTAWVCCYAWAAGSLRPIHRSLVHHSTLPQSRNGRSMTLAKFILSQNVCRVRVCKRFPFRPGLQCPVRIRWSSWRRYGVMGMDDGIGLERLAQWFHFPAPVCIFTPISQSTPVSSRATATLILLWCMRRLRSAVKR